MTADLRDKLIDNIARVRAGIDAAAIEGGRSGEDVAILAAVKYLDADVARALVEAGIVDLAESRLDHLVEHQAALDRQPARDAGTGVTIVPRWHFIGRVQSRQAVEIAGRCGMVHALCTPSAVRRLAAATIEHGDARPTSLLVQVNVAGDPGKDGLDPREVEPFLEQLPAELTVDGFMTMPELAAEPEHSRAAFAALRTLRDDLAPRLAGRHRLRFLSMGTSQDALVAVAEGATHVRLGRILYA